MSTKQFDPKFGIAGCYPSVLQRFAGIKSFTISYSISGLFSWCTYVYFISQVSTIQKQFGLSSTETGTVLTAFEIGYLLSLFFVTLFANKVHIPRFICFVTVICGIGGMVCGLPHAFSESTAPTSGKSAITVTLCTLSEESDVSYSNLSVTTVTDTDVTSANVNIQKMGVRMIALAIITLGMVIQGVSKAPCWPLTAKYVDDSTEPQETGFYIGIISCITIFGPALAYGFGSLFSKLYVTLEDVDIEPSDPRWIGAWWLGFLMIGIATVLVSLPLMCFPRTLKQKPNKALHERTTDSKKKIKEALKEMKRMLLSVVNILRTPLYLSVLVATVLNMNSTASLLSYEPKYLETQFQIPSWKSNLVLGIVSIGAICIGSLFGGWLTKVIRMTPVRCVLITILFSTLTIALIFVAMFLGCSQPVIQKTFHNGSASGGLDCGAQCNCDEDDFHPICGVDSSNYFSPCMAGCYTGTLQNYENCSCIPGSDARSGLCQPDCKMFWPWSIAKFLANFFDATTGIPFFLILIRCVRDHEKSLAIAIHSITGTLLAWLPGPVIGGKLVDSTCILWSTSSTTGRYCSLYDIEHFRYLMHGYMLGIRGVAFLLMFVCLWCAKRTTYWQTDVVIEEAQVEVAETPEKEILMKTCDNGVSAQAHASE